jgi:filamentous hemagglutinin family protein
VTSLRSRLFHGTAVATLVLVPNIARAATIALPTGGTVQVGTVTTTLAGGGVAGSLGGTASGPVHPPISAPSAIGATDHLDLSVGITGRGAGQSAVVNWGGSFDIGTLNTVTFTQPDNLAFSVLNRVTSGSITKIAGTLQGNSAGTGTGGKGTIFVINESGITFAGSAKVTNLSGFVASSLGVTDGEFANFATGTTRFIGSGTSALTVAAGASIAPDSVLLLVAPKLDIQGGGLSAAGGDAGFVLASDVKIALNPTSIISIKIDAGATVSTAQTLGGTIGGKRVLVAAATAADLVGTLLNVTGDLNATTATATSNGIVIAVGRDVPTAGVSFTTADPPVNVPGLSVTGTLTSSARIDTVSNGATDIAAATSTGGSARFASDAALTLGGNISTAGDLTGSGTSVVLGATGFSRTFAAGGQVAVTATTGSITAAGLSGITSNKTATAAVGAGDITLSAATAIGDTTNPRFIGVTGGTTTDRRAVNVAVGAGSDLHLGTVAASSLLTVGDPTGTLTTTGAITLGATAVTNDLKIGTTGTVGIASGSSTGNIAISGSALTLGIDAATRSLTAGPTGTLDLTASGGGASAITTLGDFSLSGGRAVTLQSAAGVGANISQDGSLAITGSKIFVGNIASNPAGTLAGNGDVTLTANGLATTDSLVAGTVVAQGKVAASSSAGAVTLAGATSGTVGATTHDVTVTAAGLATVAGAVTSTGKYTVTGGGVSLGGVQAAAGNVLIKSTSSDIATTGSLTADSGGAGGRLLVLDSAAAISGGGNLASGSGRESDILIATAGDITLGTIDARSLAGAATIASPAAATDYSAVVANTLITGNAFSLGAVTTTQSNTIGSTGTVPSHRDVVVASDSSTAGAVTLSSTGGTLTTGTVTAFAGGATLIGKTAIVKAAGAQTIAASGDVSLTSDGAIGVDAVRGGGTVTAGGFTGPNAASLTGDSLRAGGAVTVNTSGLITLTGLISPAISAQSVGSGLGATLANFGAGAVAAADVTLASTGGAVTVNDVGSTRNVIGIGTTFTLGTTGATHSIAAEAVAGTVTLTASNLGAAAVTVLGNYMISGGGAVALQRSAGVGANVTQNDSLRIIGKNVRTGAIALAATLPTLSGSGNVTLMAAGTAAVDSVTAGAVAARNAVTVTSAHGDVALGGATSGTVGAAPHDVTVSAAGNANVTGAVSSAGNYTVVGNGISLGGASAGITQSAVGDILVQSGTNIFASGTLAADTGGAGNRRLVLDASSGGLFNSGFGPVSLIAGSGATPTAANRSDLLLSFASGHNLALGSVDADVFSTATHAAAPATVADYTPVAQAVTLIPTLITDGAISSTAPVKTIRSIIIGTTGAGAGVQDVSLGGVTSATGSIEVYSTNGDLTLAGPVSAATFASLHADARTLTVGDVKAFGGDATLLGFTAIAKASGAHAIAALGNVLLESPGAITIDAVRAGGTATVRGLTAGSSAASLTGTSLAANGGVSISTVAAINLTGAGFTIDTPRKAIDANLAGFNGAPVGNADISLTSTGGAVTIVAIEATGNIFFNAATTATVSGNAEAGFGGGSGNYTVKGATVSLGGAGTTQKATGNVWILASGTGGISAAGTLVADDGGAGVSRLVLDSAGAITGGTNLQAGFGVTPTLGNRSDILVRLNDPTQPVTLGTIDGRSFASASAAAPASVADYTPVVGNQFETAGAVSLGAVSTARANVIGSTGTVAGARDVAVNGDTSVSGSVEVRSANGNVTLSGPVSAATSVNLHADAGTLSVGDVKAFGGDATLTGATAIAKASGARAIAASGNVLLQSAGVIPVDAVRAGAGITVRGLTAGSSAVSLTGDSLQSNGTIAVSTSGPLTLNGVGAATGTQRKLIDVNLGGFNGAATAPDADVVLASTGATVGIAAAFSTGNLTLSANGLATASGTITAGDATTGAASGNFTVTGANITLGGTGVVQSATGAIQLKSAGAIVADTLRAAGTISTAGLIAGTTPVSFAGVALQSNADITVTTTGAIALTGAGASRTAALRARFDPTLRTFTGAATAADHDISLTSTGSTVTAADLSSTGSIAASGLGKVIVSGTVAAGDGATLAGHGNYTVTGGSIALGGGVAGHAALGDILLASPGAITLTALRSGGAIAARGLAAGTSAASLIGDSLQSNGAITVATSGVINLAGVNATSVATQRNRIASNLGAFSGAATAPDASIALTTIAGAISVNGGSSTGNTTLTAGTGGAAGGITATGTLIAGDSATVTGVGDIVLDGRDLTSLANGSARRNISVTSHANDAMITTATAGTNLASGGTIVAQSLVAGGHATVGSGITTLGDVRALASAAGGVALISSGQVTQGNVLADGDASARITSGTTLGPVAAGDVTAHSASGTAIVTTGRARGTITADALTAALVSDGVAVSGDVNAISRSTTGGSATITLANGHNITTDAQFGPANVVNGQSLASGNVTATVHSGSNLASIGTATASGGNVVATQSGSGNATIGTAIAGGNVSALAGGFADITTSGNAGGDVIASGGTAHITFGQATGNVRALATSGSAIIGTGIAANGNVDALASAAATIALGTATLGNVRATSTGGGLATITSGTAGTSVVATGGSVTIGSATAGDDIIASATSGAVNATTLTITGLGTDTPATDASGTLLTGSLTGTGGSNAIIRAATTATIGGVVSIAQANAAKTANYDVKAASITLGSTGFSLDQRAAGRVDLVSTGGGVVFANTGGVLQSNAGLRRTANALADASTAGGGLSITSATGMAGATTNLLANTKDAASAPFFDTQARQPGVTLAAAAGGGGSVQIASITGGAVTVTAPATINVPSIIATGNVSLTGVATSVNDTATISPTTITIDGLNAAYARVDVKLSGGAGAELASLGVSRGGQVNGLQILSDAGAATLRAAPSDPAKITSILVESQTGQAVIINPAGGAASIANPNTVAAQSIVLRGRQAGSSVLATGPLLATGSVLATGDTVTLGTVVVAGIASDGPGDILIAATTSASLAAGLTETAVARRTINVTGGSALLGDGTATGGTLAISGSSVTVTRRAIAGDDVILTSLGALTATNATIATTGAADLQAGDDTAGINVVSIGAAAGTGYGAGHIVGTDVSTALIDATTNGNLTRLAGSNIIATAVGNIDFGVASISAAPGALQRDIHIESNGTVALATTTAARGLVVASNGLFTPTGTLTAGDDLVLVSTGAIDVRGATLRTVGSAATLPDARRADGTLLTNAAGGGSLSSLGGSNIALAAGGPIQLGLIQTAGIAPSSLRAFSSAGITTAQAVTTTGSIVLTGVTVTSPFALTAGDDIVAIARGGSATLDGVLTTTGANASNAALTEFAGAGIALPGETALGRVDGSSIVVAATGLSTVSANVASAGRYSVYGRGGITLGSAAVTPPGTTQSAAGDVLLDASIGSAPASASVTLANNMVLTANSDSVEAASGSGFIADSLVVRLGNGSLNAGGATLRALRTPAARLVEQGTVQVQSVVTDGVKSITIAALDSVRADLRALNNVTIGSATVDAGLTLASKAGAVSLTTLTVRAAVPLMTPAEIAAIDLKLSGATGATLGNVVAATNQLRDITVATGGGTASITGAAAARDDIVVASTSGAASAANLGFVGTASDSEAGVATLAATDANGIALADPYGLTGPAITGLAGRNIVVSGATGASLGTVTTAASDNLGDVRVLTIAGPATLTTVNTGGAGLPSRIIVATRNGAATGTTLNASGDIIVDATVGSATLTTGNAGRDGIVVAPTVSIDSLTAGDDIVAVATGGTLTAGVLTSTGLNSVDLVATIFRADGTAITDPVTGGNVGGMTGGNVVALGSGSVTVTAATATAAPGAIVPGLVRIASQTGTTTVTDATATAGDLVFAGAVVNATTLSAGRDATVTAGGLATIAQLTAGRDVTINAGSASLGTGTGFIGAQRNFFAATSGALTIGAARAGGTLAATGGSVLATTLGAGDALTVRATAGNATVTTASSTGRPLLADFSGFATTGSAAGTTRDILVSATGAASLASGTAVHGITVAGTSASVTSAIANTGGTDGDLAVTATTGGATLGSGSGRDIRVAATGGGSATATTATASRDLFVDASGGTATLTTGTAGRDGVVVGPSVAVGSLTADDDIVAVASAGTLTATTLRSTGANSSDAVATIARAAGGAVTDPVAGGSVAGMNGGNVIAIASGDVTVTTATAIAAPGATVPGLVRLTSLNGTTSVTTATASAGDLVLAGAAVNGGTLSAGRDATVTSIIGDLTLATITSGRDLGLNSVNDIIVAGQSNAGGVATFTALRDINLGATATGDALDTVGNATLTAGRDIVVAQRTGAGATLTATAGGVATLAGTSSGGATTIAAQGNLTLTADSNAIGPMTLSSAGGAIAVPNLSGNGITLTAANAGTVTGAATSTGALNATAGSLAFGSIATTLDATLHSVGGLTVTGSTVTGGALTATSDTGAIRTAAVTTGGPATVTAADATNGMIVNASLTTTGAATLRAGQSIEVTGAALSTGALAATATNAGLKFGSIIADGAATLRAKTALTVAGLAKSGAALDALSSAGGLSFGSTQAVTTVTLRGATGVAVTGGTAAGGAVTITADSGPIAMGDINSGGDTLVAAANGSATLGSVSRTGKLTIAAATNATVLGGITTTGDTAITATNGSATIGGAVRTANYTVKANTGTIALGAGVVQASSGTVTFDSQRLTIAVGTAIVAPTRIQLDVTGNAAGVSLGDGAGAVTGTTKYSLSKADLRKFQTPVLEVAAVGRPVNIGEFDLDGVAPVTGGFAGVTNAFGVRTTSDIVIADRLTFTSAAAATTPRVLTLGGAAGGADLDKTTSTANAVKVLAVAGLDNSVTGTGGQINAAGSIVQLRATYIALGETPSPAAGRPFIDTLLPSPGTPLTMAQAKTQFVDNASSTLYVATPPYQKQLPTPQALVKGGALVLAPGQWALIQNTGPSTTPGGGIEAGTLKFSKVAGAAAPDPVIAVFGSIAGKTGIASAISVSAGNLDGISPNNIRVNGCVALSTAGCIQSAVSIPLINLADPGRMLLISSAPDLALSVELITGATNEALWREDDDDCAPGTDKDRCAATPGQKRPQRESRP